MAAKGCGITVGCIPNWGKRSMVRDCGRIRVIWQQIEGKIPRGTANDGNRTTSTLSFVPSKEDDGQNLTCKAENPSITGTPPLSDYWTLHIQCK
ncbi:unnamed protein product [Nezara viridula]|uniref:CD80-like immunoglobulin C2-set domain-containing protein n=1 Tax=Nezara viridula TaxID=85310 RepID=A0A9P0HBP5_NEZVI|nr:unnamed protein product [Nezara viridula]